MMRHCVTLFLVLALCMPLLPRTEAGGRDAVISADFSSTLTDMRNTLDGIKKTFEGIGRFVKSISDFISSIASVINLRALVLLVAVLVFSAGFSAIGIPKGGWSFFLSLFVIDALWYLWRNSMNPDTFLYHMRPILVINGYLLIPWVALMALKRVMGRAFRTAGDKISASFTAIFLRKRIERDELLFLKDKFEDASARVLQSMEKDITDSSHPKPSFSKTTMLHLREVRALTKKLGL